MLSLIWAWTNGWVNKGCRWFKTHRAHHDIIVMFRSVTLLCPNKVYAVLVGHHILDCCGYVLLICISTGILPYVYLYVDIYTVYPKKYAHGFCFAVLCCGYTLTDIPISIRLTSLVLWQSNDCPSASKATLMNMDKYFMWIHYERLHNHYKAKHNKPVCIFLGIYCICIQTQTTHGSTVYFVPAIG